MTKIEVNRVELVWPGKFNEDGTPKEVPKVSLPFQVIERVSESRGTREAAKQQRQLGLFETWQGAEGSTFEGGWRNKLVWGDNLTVMSSLLAKFAGRVNLIYIDPPFATGADFKFISQVGESELEVEKEQSAIEEKAYRDTWGRGIDSYLSMMRDRLSIMLGLLAEDGSLYVHLDWRLVHEVKLIADELFGREGFLNDITWKRAAILGRKATSGQFGRVTDTILFYSKSTTPKFNRPYMERPIDTESWRWDPKEGKYFKTSPRGDYTDKSIAALETQNRVHRTSTGGIRIKYFAEKNAVGEWIERLPADCLWTDIPDMMHIAESEKTGYATQKPEALLRRVMEASSSEGDLVADLFCGSGTTLAVAERAGRRWIGCDLSRFAIHTTRKRLLDIEGCRPFEVLNLGRYERQYWQGITFGKGGVPQQRPVYEYLAFVLRLYGAKPVSGMQQLHGQKGRAAVHIGAVDSPVTIDEVNSAIEECLALKQTELHVLGWEWEMGMVGMMEPEAKRRGIRLLLLQIPREVMEQQAVEKGDVQFFQLAYLEVEIKGAKKLTAQVVLTGFVIPNTELIPEDVRDKVKKWSDWVDYWAVDWDFQEDTFMQGWVAYRTRKDRSLPLKSDPHTYEKIGKYTIVVKVIDIFGNDTTQAFAHEVK